MRSNVNVWTLTKASFVIRKKILAGRVPVDLVRASPTMIRTPVTATAVTREPIAINGQMLASLVPA